MQALRLGRTVNFPSNILRSQKIMKVVPVPVREDNYAYLLIDEPSKKAAAVDPWDVDKVKAAAEKFGVQLVAGITTHHHHDHSGGNEKFAKTFPSVPMYGGSNQIPALTDLVKDKDEFKVGDNIHVKCMATPCHTQDSICFHVTDSTNNNHPGGVFTGDTLFIGGCGRFFEGNATEMLNALNYLGTLPSSTVVLNGHEYTKGNLSFAKSIEPDSAGVKKLEELVQKHEITTGNSTIGDEKEWNPFMRLANPTVRSSAKVSSGASDSDVMAALRELKNNFRG
ncbi:Cytoplasmic glyoxalase II [Marasmius crinis-equi]|uniref:hydroxyacylglutathione hydrolase n=1 Tax=Marasmius crinis-equi TaxID=585013 RepID=A0ABR3ELC7_9AGAR